MYECTPIFVTLLVVILLYSSIALYLFRGQGVASDDGNEYFPTLGVSIFTHFQLFIGEGWHDIMKAAVAATDQSVMYLFVTYIILVTMLFGNLFLGVVIDLYNDMEGVQSINLHETLQISFADLEDDEQEAAFERLCDLLEEFKLLPDPLAVLEKLDIQDTTATQAQAASALRTSVEAVVGVFKHSPSLSSSKPAQEPASNPTIANSTLEGSIPGITAGTAVALNPLQEVGVLPSSSEDTGTGTNMDAQEPEPVVEGSI